MRGGLQVDVDAVGSGMEGAQAIAQVSEWMHTFGVRVPPAERNNSTRTQTQIGLAAPQRGNTP